MSARRVPRSTQDALEAEIARLRARYPNGVFTEAVERDVVGARADHAERIRDQLRDIPARFRQADTEFMLPADLGLYVHGPVGVGKTHAAAGMMRRAVVDGYCCAWLSVGEWLAEIRTSFNGGAAPLACSDLAYRDVLVLDDLGAEKPTEWVIASIFELVNAVYERGEDGPRLIVTSNLAPDDLSRRLGDRVASRIVELCEIRRMSGADRRLASVWARIEDGR
ncbi:MAG: ATP-binding protein [Coriobacteriia bacterium]|nr:ATP-binding protein [Coriobacteriia bacterium]